MATAETNCRLELRQIFKDNEKCQDKCLNGTDILKNHSEYGLQKSFLIGKMPVISLYDKDIEKIHINKIVYPDVINYSIIIKLGNPDTINAIYSFTKEHYGEKIVMSACGDALAVVSIRDTISNEIALILSERKGEHVIRILKKLTDKIDFSDMDGKDAN